MTDAKADAIVPADGQPVDEVKLGDRPGYLIKRVDSDFRACMEAMLRPLGMTIPQYACMHLLYESPGISGAELARRAFVTRQAVYLVLAELLELGWVTRESRGTGVRQGAAHLTAKGRSVAESAFQPVDEIEDAMIGGLSPDERALFADMLIRCESGLQRFLASRS